MEKAYDALRKKGLAAAAKKASRQATEGLVGLTSVPGNQTQGPAFAVVEVNSETDFVARSDLFRGLVSQVWMTGVTGMDVLYQRYGLVLRTGVTGVDDLYHRYGLVLWTGVTAMDLSQVWAGGAVPPAASYP
jgi:elongation factor Ts